MRERFYFLDGMRGIAAIMVTYYHFSQNTQEAFLRNAFYAVDLFFVLSGFVIAEAYASRIARGMSFANFLKVRLIRLYPMFLIGAAIGLVGLCVKYSQAQISMSLGEIGAASILNLFYIPFYNSGTINVGKGVVDSALFPGNNPAWSLFYEFIVNIIFFFAVAFGLYSRKSVVGALVLSGIAFLIAIVTWHGPLGWGSSFIQIAVGFDRSFFGFCVGLLISMLRTPKSLRSFDLYIAIAIGLIILALGVPGGRTPFLLAIILAPAMVWIGSFVKLDRFATKVSDVLGEISYPLYCIHYPIIFLVDAAGLLVMPHYQPLVIAIWVALCIAGAYVTAKLFDEPLRRWLSVKLIQRGS